MHTSRQFHTLICACLCGAGAAAATATELTGQQLAAHCLAVCAATTGEGVPADELPSTDACFAYIKAVIGAARAYPPQNKIPAVQSCAATFLSKRTATSMTSDPSMIAACEAGKWLSARHSILNRPAAVGLLQWVGATSCKP